MVDIAPGKISLSQDEVDWLKAISSMNGENQKAIIANAWRGHLCRHKAHYLRKLRYLAQRHGLTIEDCFRRLVEGKDLGEIREEFPLDALEELSSNTFFGSNENPKGEQL